MIGRRGRIERAPQKEKKEERERRKREDTSSRDRNNGSEKKRATAAGRGGGQLREECNEKYEHRPTHDHEGPNAPFLGKAQNSGLHPQRQGQKVRLVEPARLWEERREPRLQAPAEQHAEDRHQDCNHTHHESFNLDERRRRR